MVTQFDYTRDGDHTSDMESGVTKQAPGRNEGIGLSLIEVFDMFPDNETAEQWFADARWPAGVVCPYCEGDNVQHPTTHHSMPYRCRSCRKFFSVRTGTVMADSKLGYRVWALAIYLLNTGIKGMSSMKLHLNLKIAQSSAWHLAHRIQESWQQSPPPDDLFRGPVDADETYMGGNDRDKHKTKRSHAGRGPVGKATVVGAKGRDTGKVSARVIDAVSAQTLAPLATNRTDVETTVYTEEHRANEPLPRKHEAVSHSTGEFVGDVAHTNGVESFWSTLKRGYAGTYHQMNSKHPDRYIDGFRGRHKSRPLDAIKQMHETVRGLVCERPQCGESAS